MEWEQLKTEKPEIAEQELDVFSDLIWEGALNKTQYLEHFSKSHIFLFLYSRYVKKHRPFRFVSTVSWQTWLSLLCWLWVVPVP